MIDEHEQFKQDLVAHAVDALEAADRDRLEVHLRGCDECPRLLEELRSVAGLLPYALTPEAPPPSARTVLLSRVRGSRPGSAVADRELAPTLVERLLGFVRPVRWAAAAAVVIVAALIWNVVESPVPHPSFGTEIAARLPGGQIIGLVGTGMPTGTARLYVVNDRQRGELAVAGLAPLPPDRIYQVWFARPGHPTVTGGVFRVGADGETVAPVIIPAPLDEVRAIAVTEEPAPGSPGPTGEHLLDWAP